MNRRPGKPYSSFIGLSLSFSLIIFAAMKLKNESLIYWTWVSDAPASPAPVSARPANVSTAELEIYGYLSKVLTILYSDSL